MKLRGSLVAWLAVGGFSACCFTPSSELSPDAGPVEQSGDGGADAGPTGPPPPTTCTIDGSSYADGTADPANPCQGCHPSVSTSRWTAVPDGVGCGRDGLCAAGVCGPIGCTVGGAQFLNRASNPADPSLCCNVIQNPGGWTARFLDGGVFPGAGYGKSVAGDFNGDGLADIASADYENRRVLVLINQSGFLVPTGTYPIPDLDRDILTADLNRDGFDDLVTHNGSDSSSATISVLLSRGDGTFSPAITFASCPDVGQQEDGSIKEGDFNGDGIPDLAVACGLFFAGIGDGRFLPPTSIPLSSSYPNGADYLAVGDFNGDGALDVAVDSFSAGVVAVTLGSGSGTFTLGGQYAASGSSPFALGVGDFDGDGIADLVVQAATNDNGPWKDQGIALLQGLGGGNFGAAIWLPMGDGTPGGLVVPNLAGNGKQELVAANADRFMGQLTFEDGGARIAPTVGGPGSFLFYPTKGDFNGDHADDLAVGLLDIGLPGSRIAVYLNGCP